MKLNDKMSRYTILILVLNGYFGFAYLSLFRLIIRCNIPIGSQLSDNFHGRSITVMRPSFQDPSGLSFQQPINQLNLILRKSGLKLFYLSLHIENTIYIIVGEISDAGNIRKVGKQSLVDLKLRFVEVLRFKFTLLQVLAEVLLDCAASFFCRGHSIAVGQES